jgi:hypothetical protein
MKLTQDLSEEQVLRLEQLARELDVDVRELAKAAVTDLLSRPAAEFERAASYVLAKNRQLYERLT